MQHRRQSMHDRRDAHRRQFDGGGLRPTERSFPLKSWSAIVRNALPFYTKDSLQSVI